MPSDLPPSSVRSAAAAHAGLAVRPAASSIDALAGLGRRLLGGYVPDVHPLRRPGVLAGRRPLAGPVLWLSCVQYFLVQAWVAAAWEPPYSWRLDAISDLGATRCGQFDGRSVCSPWHGLMNTSLVLLGLSMTIGSALLYRELRGSRTGFLLMGTAGAGAVLVGLFPEDTTYWAHIAGADLAFLLGNIALIVFGRRLPLPRWLRWYSIASGAVALVALCLFLTHHRFFLELGGMERVVAYPQTIWLIVFGLYMIRGRRGSGTRTPTQLPAQRSGGSAASEYGR